MIVARVVRILTAFAMVAAVWLAGYAVSHREWVVAVLGVVAFVVNVYSIRVLSQIIRDFKMHP